MKTKLFFKDMQKNLPRIIGGSLVVFFLLYLSFNSSVLSSNKSATLIAKDFIALCAEKKDKAKCYEEEVPKLLEEIPLEKVFSVVREIKKQDQSYQFCHVLGHEIGVWEVERNPDAWIDLMHKNPSDSLCSNGYIHGIIVGRFNKAVLSPAEIEAIAPDLSRACEPTEDWKPTGLDKAMCYHGMGHVLTQISGPDMPLSVKYCRQIAVKHGEDYSKVCISGVFMQIFQPLEPEDFALIERLPVKPTKKTLVSFCGTYPTEIERSQCFGEGWPLFQDELKTAEGIQSFCTLSENALTQRDCFTTVLSIGARGSLWNPQKQEALCVQLPERQAQTCFNFLAEAFVEEDRTQIQSAVDVCKRTPAEFKDGCFGYLLALSDFTFGGDTAAKKQLCEAFPDDWRKRCEAGERPPVTRL